MVFVSFVLFLIEFIFVCMYGFVRIEILNSNIIYFPTLYRSIQRTRDSINSVSRQTRPQPWRRSFGRPGSVPPDVIAERKLQWRAR